MLVYGQHECFCVNLAVVQMAENEKARTGMIQVFPELPIPMASRCNVKVSLDLVPVQAPKNSATVRRTSHPRRLGKLPLSRLTQLPMHIPQFFPIQCTVFFFLAQFMNAPLQVLARPLAPVCRVFAQEVTGKGAVASGVLHVDVEISAPHGDNDVKVDLHVVGHTLLDRKRLRGGPGEPARDLGPRQVETCQNECGCPGGGVTAPDQVGLLCLGCSK